MTNNKLLPKGFCDFIGERVVEENNFTTKFLEITGEKNYQPVIPSMVEFTENLFCETEDLRNNSFRFIDPVSNKLIAISPDITLQIARISKLMLDAGEELPLKIAYSGRVFRSGRKIRQITQAGIEVIGEKNNESIIEIINIALEILGKDKLLTFSVPNFIDDLLGKEDTELKEAARNKDISKIKEIGGEFQNLLLAIILPTDNFFQIISLLKSHNVSENLQNKVSNLIDIIIQIKELFPDIRTIIDISEFDKSGYHTDIAFNIFDENKKSPLVRGGSYKVNDLEAVGLSFYVDTIL